jgi:hypothetical protein
MYVGLPMAGLPVSIKWQTRGRLQVVSAPESHLNYQVGRACSHVMREMNAPLAQLPG